MSTKNMFLAAKLDVLRTFEHPISQKLASGRVVGLWYQPSGAPSAEPATAFDARLGSDETFSPGCFGIMRLDSLNTGIQRAAY